MILRLKQIGWCVENSEILYFANEMNYVYVNQLYTHILTHTHTDTRSPIEESKIDQLGDVDSRLLFQCTCALVRQICAHNAEKLSSRVPSMLEELPSDLPDDMSSKFKTCSLLVELIRDDLSFPKNKELSFDVFLYPNELRTRQLLGWLVEKLMDALNEEEGSRLKSIGVQKRQKKLSVETLLEEQRRQKKRHASDDGSLPLLLTDGEMDGDDDDLEHVGVSLQDRIHHTLHRLVKSQWITTPARRMGMMRHRRTQMETHHVHTVFVPQNAHEEKFLSKYASLITDQVKNAEHLAASVIEDNARHVVAYEHREHELQRFHELSPEDYLQRSRQNVMNAVASRLRSAMNRATESGRHRRGFNADIGTINDSVSQMLSRLSHGGAKNFVDASTFINRVQFETEQKEAQRREELDPEEEEERRAREIEKMQSMMDRIVSAMEQLRVNNDTLHNTINQTEDNIQQERTSKKLLEDEFKLKKKTSAMFQDKENNIREMEQLNAESAERLVQLAREWEHHRQPLVDRYRALKDELANRKTNYRRKLEEIKQQRELMKQHIGEVRQKEQLIVQLQEEYEEMPKESTRESYVSKILDVVRNIEKQKQEIHKVMLESRDLRRETGILEEKLDRTFQDAEALIFSDANNPKVGTLHQDTSKTMYRYLVQIKKLFDDLISHVEETGKATSSIRMLEHQIDHITQRNDSLNVERLEQDLQFIRSQNKELLQQLRTQASA